MWATEPRNRPVMMFVFREGIVRRQSGASGLTLACESDRKLHNQRQLYEVATKWLIAARIRIQKPRIKARESKLTNLPKCNPVADVSTSQKFLQPFFQEKLKIIILSLLNRANLGISALVRKSMGSVCERKM